MPSLSDMNKKASLAEPLCIKCRGRGWCGKSCPIVQKMSLYKNQLEKIKKNFSASPPSVFIGRYNYPNVNVGILSPPRIDEQAWKLDAPEFWYNSDYSIDDVFLSRTQLVNTRTKGFVKKPTGRFVETVQELAMAQRPASTEFELKKKPKISFSLSTKNAPIGAPAQVKRATLEENPKIPKIVDYVTGDELRAAPAMSKLYEKGISVNHITKILSTGLLGLKKKLVPTRWSITATDDTVGKQLLSKVRDFKWLSEIQLFHNEYLGNHYEILLMPRQWSFELIEAKTPGSVWNPAEKTFYMIDYEPFSGRTSYAENCGGGYYAARLPVLEHLCQQKRQASVFIIREVKPTYSMPLGVWVCRETARGAFQNRPEKFGSLQSVLDKMFMRLNLPRNCLARSRLLQETKQQKTLVDF